MRIKRIASETVLGFLDFWVSGIFEVFVQRHDLWWWINVILLDQYGFMKLKDYMMIIWILYILPQLRNTTPSINKYQQKELKLKTYEYYEMDQDDQLMTSYQFNMLPWYVEIEVNYMNIWFVCIIAATTKKLTTMFFFLFFPDSSHIICEWCYLHITAGNKFNVHWRLNCAWIMCCLYMGMVFFFALVIFVVSCKLPS